MVWSDQWIGIPYLEDGRSLDGIDCLGFFLRLQKERMDRDLFDPLCDMRSAVRNRTVENAKLIWNKIDPSEATEGDGVLFNVAGRALHIGYCLDRRFMLHCEKEPGSVIENWKSSIWLPRLEGVYRYVD